MFGDSTTAPGEPKLVGYPTLAYAPETRWEFGASLLYVYHAQRKPENRLSEISTFAFVTLEQQYGLWLDHALYTDENRWYFLGRVRAQSFPLRYHGIGTEAPAEYQAYVAANQIWWRERILRRVGNDNWFVGLDADVQSLWNVDFQWQPEATNLLLPLGNGGSFNMGLGPSIVYDNRENVLNVRHGLYAVASGLIYHPALGSEFNFSQFFTEVRGFVPVNERQVFAAQAQAVFNNGDVPFNQLALMGGESLMRGYYLGRYRDRQMLAAQVEYRWLPFDLPFTDRIGAAVFIGAGTVAPTVSDLINVPWQISGGGGLRVLIFPDKDIYTRLDVGFTREGPGYYLYIGEAF
ncbi:MAG TPA: hypothetical protein DCE41_13510 [Cytophagales bacterium]|nr:hypothetical protein [Cytophagales bacterium]HAP60926.1 hypothetical protein [Cytophagales bacterium]